jgi:hypothetical protein
LIATGRRSGEQVDSFSQRFADDLQRGADDRVVPAGPGALLALLDRRVVDH